MHKSSSFPFLRWIAIALVLFAVFLAIINLVRFSRVRSNFPPGLKVAGIPIGGLDNTQAAQLITKTFSQPIELKFSESIIQVRPSVLGFEADIDKMLAVADKQRVTQEFWTGFWNYLWNTPTSYTDVPLQYELDEEKISQYLSSEIAPRYNIAAVPPLPVPDGSGFYAGKAGAEIDLARAKNQIIEALKSPTKRSFTLALTHKGVSRPPISSLEPILKSVIDYAGFDGIVELYMMDLESNQAIQFAYQNQQNLPVDIAFSSWSTIKIPVMVSAYKLLDEPVPYETMQLLIEMIDQSENTSTDALAKTVLEENLAPIIVTEDMTTLGLKNTFWSGFFHLGAPLLRRVETPANLRTDINTNPDIYNQTTVSDMGLLMEDIYQCAEYNGGALIAAFDGQITQSECQNMLELLGNNKIAVLLQSGVPGGVTVAHKHGWAIENDGLVHTFGDVGLVYSPGGNYVLVIFLYHPVQAVFEDVNKLYGSLSGAVYNFFNMEID